MLSVLQEVISTSKLVGEITFTEFIVQSNQGILTVVLGVKFNQFKDIILFVEGCKVDLDVVVI